MAFDVKHTERPWVVVISSEERNQKRRAVGWASGAWMVKTDRGQRWGWAAPSGVRRRVFLRALGFPFLSCIFFLLGHPLVNSGSPSHRG